MAKATVNINSDAAEEIAKSPEMTAYLEYVGEVIRDRWAELSPGEDFPETIQTMIVEPGRVAVFTPSPLAHLIEFGTQDRYTRNGAYRGIMPTFAPARRAVDSLGLELNG